MTRSTSFLTRFLAASGVAGLIAGSAVASPAANKQVAIDAINDLFSRQDASAVDRAFAAPYTQHNTMVPDGVEGLRGLAKMSKNWKGLNVTIHRALAEGDLVVLNCTYSNLGGVTNHPVTFDLFRFKDGKAVEHWDAAQDSPMPNASGHTLTDGETEITDRSKTKANRAVVLKFIGTVLIDGKLDQVGRFVDDRDYVEHDPHSSDGLTALKAALTNGPAAAGPETKYLSVHKTIAEGNFVFVQGEGQHGGEVIRLYNLYRLKGGKIVEHWDVIQPVAPVAQWNNRNGPF